MQLRIAAFLALASLPAWAGDGRREISQSLVPYVITNGGSYILTENLAATNGQNGIVVQASDVVIDLNGFALAGGPGSLSGVAVPAPRMNLVVRNGALRGWGQHGVDASSVSNGLLQDLQVSHCGQDGLRTGSGWIVERCTLSSQGRDGLAASSHVIAAEVVSRNNGRFGLSGGDYCLAASADVRENAGGGILFARYSSVTRSTLRDNGGNGVELGMASVLADALTYGCTSNGVVVGAGSRVEKTQVSSAGQVGIVAASAVAIQDCTIKNCTNGGVRAGELCFILDNSIDESLAGPGIRVTGYGNRVEANNLTRNAVGLHVTGVSNLLFKNTAYLNAPTNYVVGASNVAEIVLNPGGNENNANFEEPWCNFDIF